MAILDSFLPVPPEFSNCFSFWLCCLPGWSHRLGGISVPCGCWCLLWAYLHFGCLPWIQTHVSTSLFCLMSDMSLQLSLFQNWAPDFLFLVSLTFPVSLETSRVILSLEPLRHLWFLSLTSYVPWIRKSCQLHLQNVCLSGHFFSLHLDPPWSKPPSSSPGSLGLILASLLVSLLLPLTPCLFSTQEREFLCWSKVGYGTVLKIS